MTTDTDSAPRAVVVVVNDLMFGSRVRAAAEQEGVPVAFARSSEALHAQATSAELVLLDLNTRWLRAAEEIRALKANAATQHVRIIAFGSHLSVESLTAAREAGADRVMANSAFVQLLPELLRR
jgi:CheY-like chemotaxis protein